MSSNDFRSTVCGGNSARYLNGFQRVCRKSVSCMALLKFIISNDLNISTQAQQFSKPKPTMNPAADIVFVKERCPSLPSQRTIMITFVQSKIRWHS